MDILISACFAFFLVFPVYIIVSAVQSSPSKREKEREELKKLAIERGHVVTAELVKIQSDSVQSASSSFRHNSMGIYKYIYNGKKYRFTYQSDNSPGSITLYFVSNPRKATVARALKRKRAPWLIIYAVAVAIMYMLVNA
jgi:hypothetical protein